MGLVAERMAVVRKIGALKAADRLSIRDPEIEAKILERAEESAEELNLPKGIIRQFYESLIEASVDEQKRVAAELIDRESVGKCVIYGGAGGMGRLMAELMMLHGYDVSIVRSSGAILSYPEMRESDASIGDSNLSIVSVPMSVTAEIIERSAIEVPGKKIYEICSMKNHLKEAIVRIREKGTEVVSLHPMFGPEIGSFKDKPVLFCGEERDQFSDDPLWKAFEVERARLITVPFESHDRLMSYILQLTHAINIIYFTMLSNSGIDFKEIARAASPICDRQLSNADAVAQQDPKLYFEIQRLSGHLEHLLDELKGAEKKLIEALSDDSGTKFEALMKKGKEYFEGG